MRVISGKAARLILKAPPGMEVRPTTDRIKETLFNIISPDIYGSDFLDIFAGSGAIGIEALSRGANSCVFVESSRASKQAIEENLKTTRLTGAEMMFSDAEAAMDRLAASGKTFDLIFMDPPYNKELEKKILLKLDKNRLLRENGLIIVEASRDTDFSYISGTCFTITREKSYGSNKHIFLRYKE